jgi:hypothetical protein
MRKLIVAALAALSIATLATPASAVAKSQKFPCKVVGMAQLDPVVVPDGGPSSHMHLFLGNTGVPKGVHTYDEAIQQTGTCNFPGDTASYWTPPMYDANGNVIAAKGVVYYDRMTSQKIVAFPPDFGMVWGANRGLFNSKQRSFYGWNCDNTQPLQRNFANVDCRSFTSSSNVVTFRAFSPYCWDGVIPAERNYADHVFYPDNYPTNQLCPAGAKVLPRIRVNFNFQTKYNPNGYIASDVAGQHGDSAHTDFWNVWQQSALEGLVTQLNG